MRTVRLLAFFGVALAAAALGPAASARAGLIADDLHGLLGWHGTQHFQATPSLYLNVDYCVYAPGAFDLTFGSGADPSHGTQYVYAYQILNDIPGHPAPDPLKDYVTSFSVGLSDRNEQPANVAVVTVTGGKTPALKYFSPAPPQVPSTVTWKFTTSVKSGSFSNILLYTSPFGPELDNATILGYSADTHLLPSPLPEPATLMLMGGGLAAILWQARRRAISTDS